MIKESYYIIFIVVIITIIITILLGCITKNKIYVISKKITNIFNNRSIKSVYIEDIGIDNYKEIREIKE